MRLLLVEDDRMIGESLMRGLRDDGYAVDWARDGAAALIALRDTQAQYSLALLDWNLPKQDGLSVLRALRASGNSMPILMITARADLEDRVAGLDGGADDYLSKPFALAEVKARIRSLLRQRAGRASAVLVHGSLVLDPVTHTLRQRDVAVTVTAREFALLRVLMERPDAVLSRAQLEEQLYGWDKTVESNAVESLFTACARSRAPRSLRMCVGVGWRLGNPS